MEKLTFNEARDILMESRGKEITCVAVITADSFDKKDYNEVERSYAFSPDNKAFYSSCSNSIFSDCLDGKDLGVRLDWYVKPYGDMWTVDYCYIVNADVNAVLQAVIDSGVTTTEEVFEIVKKLEVNDGN